MNTMNGHEDRVCWDIVVRTGIPFARKGFLRNLAAGMHQCGAAESPMDAKEILRSAVRFPYFPDAHRVDVDRRLVIALEIEDTHPLDLKKLLAYSDLWFFLDDICIDLILLASDNAGNIREMDLAGLWHSFRASPPEREWGSDYKVEVAKIFGDGFKPMRIVGSEWKAG